jgi:hypothetical protein
MCSQQIQTAAGIWLVCIRGLNVGRLIARDNLHPLKHENLSKYYICIQLMPPENTPLLQSQSFNVIYGND